MSRQGGRSSSGTPRSSIRTSRSSCTSPPRPATPPTSCRRSGRTATRASSTRATRPSGPASSSARSSSGLLPEGTELSPDQPARRARADRSRRPALAAARHRAALGLADRRRAAAVRPHGRGVRRLHLLQRRPLGRVLDYLEESDQIDNTLIVVISDNGASGEGGPNGSFNEWRFFNGVRRHHRADDAPHRRARHPGVEQPLQHRLGLGPRHPVPLLEAVGRRRGRRGRHVHHLLAGEDPGRRPSPASSTSTPSTWSRPSTSCSASSRPEVDQRLPAEPDRGRELRRRAHRSRRRPARGRSSTRCSGQRSIYHEGWLASTVHPPLSGLGQLRARTSGSSSTWRRPVAVAPTSPPTDPERLETLKGLWFYYAGIYNGLPLDDRTAIEQVLAERPRRWPARDRYIFYPNCADVPESAGSGHPRPVVHHRRRREGRLGRRRGRALGGTAACPAATASTSRTSDAPLHVQLDRHRPPGRRRRREPLTPGSPRPHRRVRGHRAAAPTRTCRAPRAR